MRYIQTQIVPEFLFLVFVGQIHAKGNERALAYMFKFSERLSVNEIKQPTEKQIHVYFLNLLHLSHIAANCIIVGSVPCRCLHDSLSNSNSFFTKSSRTILDSLYIAEGNIKIEQRGAMTYNTGKRYGYVSFYVSNRHELLRWKQFWGKNLMKQ